MSNLSLVTSVRQRLQRIAKESGQDFNSIQLRYVQERFLYRLSKSAYKNAFILKGALLFVAFKVSRLRPTKDIDFLGNSVTNKLDDLHEILKKICSIKYDDAVSFDIGDIETSTITEGKEYSGVRAKITASLGTAKITLWLDFGFGDKIVAGPVELDFPALLDFESPKIKVYSLESAIAEKFEACVKLNFDTSRMKDFYDINELASHNSFSVSILAEAIKETFSARETDINHKKIIFSDDFKYDKNKGIQWNAFLKRTTLVSQFSFNEIIDRIEQFIETALLDENKERRWNNIIWEWE